ncbi:alpha/beta hydrolase [Odoribacter lunatus]|uniref:alpha/beta hydrolase n=1 Tax=Odoribacter lunatus TaxID=2941335 RepID=UPI00203F0A09|nr:alpha/beta hydrolase family protein [Odoribacter lunatus]
MRTRFLGFILLLSVCLSVQAQNVDTINIYSPSMNKEIKNVLILPESYGKDKNRTYPTVYLLHGFGGRYDTWLKNVHTNLPELASLYNVIIVCPDGAKSWYWDSPVNPESRYETYVSQELTNYIDAHYATGKVRESRAIAGFSMGGHGALWLTFRHPDIFGAAGSMSGGVDIRPFPNRWDMKQQLGEYYKNPESWDAHTVINQIPYPAPLGQPALIIDCGSEDFFYEVNKALHEKLLYYHIPHDFIIRPGAHNGKYWKNAIEYQLLFFHNYFKKNGSIAELPQR